MVGDKFTYDGPVSTLTAYLTTSKLRWKSVLSTPDRKYLIVDAKNFYLNNPMMKAEYYKIAIKLIPHEIIDKYDLNNNKSYSYIYVIFEELIYGLVQAGVITHKGLKEHLKPYGCAPSIIAQGIWKHQDRDINFTLLVDNFGVRYRNKNHADHLISALQEKYEVTQD